MNRELAAAARRWADAQSDRIAAAAATTGQVITTIDTVTPGGARDGNALVTVTWRGNPVTCAGYASSYTPVEGHRVVCDVISNQLVIAYQIIGYP